VTRNIDANGPREIKQAKEEGRTGGQGSSEVTFLRCRTPVPTLQSSDRSALGKRECEVFRLLAYGKCNKEIAPLLNISVKTVETYRSRIMGKLNIHSIAQLIRYAVQNKIVVF
jgi:DNA-binding NarL/FixJ family response regulator